MAFLASLFCRHGFDNRLRYFTISLCNYLFFIIFSTITIDNISASLLVLATHMIIAAFTLLRRINDAQQPIQWFIAINITVFIAGIVVVSLESDWRLGLLLFPLAGHLALLTYPEQGKRYYILGYAGPVDLSQYQQIHHSNQQRRIEPTLVGTNNPLELSEPLAESQSAHTEKTQTNDIPDYGEQIRTLIVAHKLKAISTLLGISLIAVIFTLLPESSDKIVPSTETLQNTVTTTGNEYAQLEKLHNVHLPDNFSVYLTSHQGVIISWQAQNTTTETLWSQLRAKGDQSCATITFNKGQPIRTLAVMTDEVSGYHAYFSPLDTEELINALAFRGNFTLCDYKFSLSGSQAALGRATAFATFLSY